jgi:hypothetical protein
MSLLNPPVILSDRTLFQNLQTYPYANQTIRYLPVVAPHMMIPTVEIDSGLNDNYLAQKQVTEWLLFRMLDKWLYNDDMCHILKYLKVSGGKVSVIENANEYKSNKICSDSIEDVEKKADFLEANYLDMHTMRKLLMKLVTQLGYKWYDLLEKESLVVDVVGKYLRKKLKENMK